MIPTFAAHVQPDIWRLWQEAIGLTLLNNAKVQKHAQDISSPAAKWQRLSLWQEFVRYSSHGYGNGNTDAGCVREVGEVTTLKLLQNGHHFAEGIFKLMFLNKGDMLFLVKIIKTPSEVSCSTRTPQKSPSRNPEYEGGDFWGSSVEQNAEGVWFIFLSSDFLNLYLYWELFLLSYCHLPKVFHQKFILFESKFKLFISRQSLGIQASTMAMSRDNYMTMGSCDSTDFESCWMGPN